MSSDTQRNVWVLVFPGFELMDLSGPLCAFNLASDLHRVPYRVQVITAHGGTVTTGSGLPIHTLKASRSRSVDTLLIAGGATDSVIDADADTVALIRKLAPRT